MNKLKHKLSLIFILFSLGIIFLISTASNILIKANFNSYISSSIDDKKNEIYSSVSDLYNSDRYDLYSIENIGMNALKNGLIIRVNDTAGNVIWNARTHNNGMCESIIENVASNMDKVNSGVKSEYKEDSYEIKRDNKIIAKLVIGYYGPFYYSDSDVLLLKTLNNIFFVVALVALVISVIIGILIAASLSKPIFNIIKGTNLIAAGNYKNRVENSSIQEINVMINSVNKLAFTLEHQDNMRKTLTKDIAHELRTPLTTIKGQLEALLDKVWEPTEERLNSTLDEINRLSRLVGLLGNLSKYESDNLELNISKVRVDKLLNKIVLNFQKKLLDKGISLKLELKECYLYGDEDKLSQAIINIISNSIKYTEDNGKITIGCSEVENIISIWVKDTGIGISKEHIPFIFERFYRVDQSRTRATGGSGIGLAIANAIAHAHGGYIKVSSELNVGSEFILELPFDDKQ